MKATLILAAALSLAACSTAPAGDTGPAPAAATTTAASSAAVNPVGRYEFSTSVQGQTLTGTILIAGTPGAYTGQISTSMTPPLPISGVTVDGQEMTVVATGPDGSALSFQMNFTDGTNFTGGWEMGGDNGSLTGRRVS